MGAFMFYFIWNENATFLIYVAGELVGIYVTLQFIFKMSSELFF